MFFDPRFPFGQTDPPTLRRYFRVFFLLTFLTRDEKPVNIRPDTEIPHSSHFPSVRFSSGFPVLLDEEFIPGPPFMVTLVFFFLPLVFGRGLRAEGGQARDSMILFRPSPSPFFSLLTLFFARGHIQMLFVFSFCFTELLSIPGFFSLGALVVSWSLLSSSFNRRWTAPAFIFLAAHMRTLCHFTFAFHASFGSPYRRLVTAPTLCFYSVDS
jgi:hypothetical protein